MKLIICLLALLPAVTGLSQDQDITFKVKAGSFVKDVVPEKEIYWYPSFSKGKVKFRNGVVSSGWLNYNILLGQMQFIDGAADTLSLANEETIDRIEIRDDVFYYAGEYFRQVSIGEMSILAERLSFAQYTEKQVSNSMNSSSTAVSNLGFILERKAYTTSPAEDLVLVKRFEYVILDSHGSLVYPDKKRLLKAFKKYKLEITDFMNNHSTDPNNKEDLSALNDFLNGLK